MMVRPSPPGARPPSGTRPRRASRVSRRLVSTEGALRIAEVARLAGVPHATIQHYLREGLLPAPVKTSRTQALYDPACVDRIRLVKELQRRYLPLDVIRRLLPPVGVAAPDGTASQKLSVVAQAALRLRDVLEPRVESLSREEVPPVTGVSLDRLTDLELLGIVGPARGGRLGPADVEILRILGRFAAAGLGSENGFQPEDLLIYLQAMRELLAREVALFSRKVVGKRSSEDVVRLGVAASTGATELIIAIRNKLIGELIESASPRRARGRRT